VISTDAYEAFTEGDGPYDKEVAKRLYESVLAWEILQIKKMLTEFWGRDPKVIMRTEVLIPLKRRIKNDRTVFSLIKRERFEFQIALLYI
jgi:hypothetical protein